MADIQTVAPTTYPVTLTDVRSQLNLSSTADDTLIQSMIGAATDLLEKRSNRAFITQTRRLTMDGFDDPRYVHSRQVFLPRCPVLSSSAISYVDTNGTTQTLPSTDYSVSTGDIPGRVAEAYGATWPATRSQINSVTVNYRTGYGSTQSSVPETIKHAIRLLVGHWYRNREAVIVGTISKDLEFTVDALMAMEDVPNYG